MPLLLLAGCRSMDCEDPKEGGTEGLFSPSDGLVIRVPWVPVIVNVPDSMGGAKGEMWIDGVCATDPLAQLAPRYSWYGDGTDYIATLDMRDLEPGEHRLDVHVAEGWSHRWVTTRFVWDRPPHRVTLHVEEDRAARVLVLKDGEPLNLFTPDMAEADPAERDTRLSSVFVLGEAVLDLDPGYYTFIAVRSILDDVGIVEVEIDDDADVWLSVPERVPMPGWSTGDFHVHTAASKDGFTPLRPRYESLIAAGLDIAVLTDHDRITDPGRARELLAGADSTHQGIPGIEASAYHPDDDDDGQRESLAHLVVFPITPGTQPPDTDITTIGEYLSAWRRWGRENPYEGITEPLIELNHPRGIQFFPDENPMRIHSLFTTLGFDRSSPVGQGANDWMLVPSADGTQIPLDFDAMELINRFSWELYEQVRHDWFHLMNQGYFIAATGNSDSHALEVELAGMTVNLIPCPASPTLDLTCILESVRGGRSLVSTGPVVELRVFDASGAAFSPGERATGPVTAEVRVRAASWVPVRWVDLVVNGHTVRRATPDDAQRDSLGTLDFTWQVPLELSGDAWIIAEAKDPPVEGREGGLYDLIAPGYAAVGFTNPVWVDLDGDGAWTPPGLH